MAASAFLSIHSSAQDFYQRDALFSTRPDATKEITNLTRLGPVGLSIDFVQPALTIRISGIEPGSPADKTGQLKPGMIIESINGQKLAAIDPRIQLGNVITAAEAKDGKLVMKVADKPGGASKEVIVQLEPLGAYSKTWPLDCPKSERIVRNFADYLKQPKANQGFTGIGMLFLLSTGDDSDIDHVRKWARSQKGSASYPWHIGYGGLALCEYYLRTGDKEVLPAIQKMADKLVEMENFGGWAGRGPTASLGYGGGGGHLNAAGTLCVGYLMLAKECGANVNDDALQRVLRRFFRYAGRGNVPYGMGKPETGYTDNGKNGKLAFSMAAAASLDPRGEKSIYARARDTSSQFAFYSTSYMLHGHTGGGIGEIWRSASMGLVRDDLPKQYRGFMDNRRWHYELSRRHNGSFAILGGERYDNEEWGAGYALTYTVPRKTLRLTGAPPTKYSKTYKLPERPWGTAEDDDFQSILPALGLKVPVYDLSSETFAKNTGMPMLRFLRRELDETTLRTFIGHPNIVIRSAAARSIHHHGESLLMELLKHDDARVRRAAMEGLRSQPAKLMSRQVFEHVVSMLNDSDESWFVKECAIEAIGKAPKEWVVEQVDLILGFLKHEEWWLHQSALAALAPVVADERCYKKVLSAIGEFLKTNYYYNLSAKIRWGAIAKRLQEAAPHVQKLARETLEEAYLGFVEYDHKLERVENIVNPMTLDALADALTKLPGGYDVLYQLGKQRYPEQKIPFKELLLKADPELLSPELKKLIDQAIGGNLIPAYLEKNRETLRKEAISEKVKSGKMGGLVALYNKVGVDEYNWQDFGPHPGEMKWYHHSFDPPEKWMKDDDRLGRYRPVTFPKGMEQWFGQDFSPEAAGWKIGPAPFGAADGKKERMGRGNNCKLSFCKCTKPIQTLWEKDVILIRNKFEFPPLEEGYRYRLLHGGTSHVGLGGGFRLYINGKLFTEQKTGVDRRGGSRAMGRVITKDWWPEFEGGEVTLSAISFKKHHPRSKKYGGNISIFMQRMKVPPVEE